MVAPGNLWRYPLSPMGDKYKMFTVAGLGALLATFESSSINVALPSLSDFFQSDIDVVSWVILAYTLAVGPTLLLFAALAQRVGIRRIYLWGFTLFSIGCLLAGFSHGLIQLLLARVVQGVGASMIMSLGPAVITQAFPKGERGKGMGMVAIVVGGGLLSGPLLGGYLVTVDWRLIFFAPLVFSWIPILLVFRVESWKKAPVGTKPFNPLSGMALFVALGAFLYGLKTLNDSNLNVVVQGSFFLVSLMAAGLFFSRERNPATRLIGFELLRNRNFSISVLVMFFLFVASSATFVLIPFFVERELSLSAQRAGMFLAIVPSIMILLAPAAGRIADRLGSRWLVTTGLGLVCVGAYMLRGISATAGEQSLLWPLIVFGAGMGISMTPNSSDMMGSAGEKMRSVASGLLATTRTMSITMGVAVSAALFVYFSEQRDSTLAYEKVFTFSLLSALLAFALSWFRQSGKR